METPVLEFSAPPRRILAICTRRLGDVLLTTALLRSLRRAWPGAGLDVVTLRGSAAALEGNPDVTQVIPLPDGAGLAESLRAIGGLRRYDLALSTLYSDRSHLMAFAAAPRRAGVVAGTGVAGTWWKRLLADATADLQGGGWHAVIQYLRLADVLGIPRCPELVPPRPPEGVAADLAEVIGGAPYAVIHPAALFRYKGWTLEGWRALAHGLVRLGLRVIVDGGPGEAERAYLDAVLAGVASPDVTRLPRVLRFAELTPLLEGARLYVGPDTGVTHLAAAAGTPSVALFGPMSPVAWGPWPRGHDGQGRTPWRDQAALQQRGNVWLVQGLTHCTPCHLEGCERRPDSRADCLEQLPASRVLAVAEAALRHNAPPSGRAASPD